jgi:hypothetical protein
MASQYQPIWSSSINCQQLARLFLTEGLGLTWPKDVAVTGDVLPVVIDVSIIMCILSKDKVKTKKKAKRTDACSL